MVGFHMTGFAIRTEGLTRDFKAVRAVDNMSLEVPSGIIFGFLGPNGSGKTTTIHLLLGLLEPTAGSAQVLGYDTVKQSGMVRERCGALLEFSGLYERMSAEDNLDFYGRVWKMPAQERKERIKELLTHVGLWERRNENVKTWSRGMKQKLAVSRALLHHPSLVFLDEPTAGLDPVAAAALRDDLSTLVKKEGATVFITTHNLAEAERLCGKVGVISKGRLLKVGTPAELKAKAGGYHIEIAGSGFTPSIVDAVRARPEVAGASVSDGVLTIELKTETSTAPIVSALVSGGVSVEEVRKGKESLEEAFLAIMEDEKEEA